MGEHFSVGLGVFASFAHQRSRFEEVQAGGLEGYDTRIRSSALRPRCAST